MEKVAARTLGIVARNGGSLGSVSVKTSASGAREGDARALGEAARNGGSVGICVGEVSRFRS